MPKDWEVAYKEEITPWDKGEAAPPLRTFLKAHRISGRICVPGCGAGHDVRLLAEQKDSEVVGLDIAPSALAKARKMGGAGNLSYELADFLSLQPKYANQFDWLIEHTCLCAIDRDRRSDYADSVYKALKPGGYLLAIFFKQVREYDGDGPPHPIDDAEISSLFGDSFELVEAFVPKETYSSRPVGCEEVRWLRKR